MRSKRASKPKGARELHHYFLYRDPEFVAAIKRTQRQLDSKYHNGIGLDSQLISASDRDELSRLAWEFGTDIWGLAYFAAGYHQKGYPLHVPVSVDTDNKTITLTIGKHTTIEHVKEAWYWVEAYKKQLYGTPRPKSKELLYPGLVYAVFRALKKGKTMPQIFKLYEASSLPLYDKKPIFDTVAELSRYYNKYKPI